MAGELEGVPVATLVPHLYPVGAPGFPPYALGARLPRTRLGHALWSAVGRGTHGGLRQGRDELNETRRKLGLPPVERLHGGLSERLCLVGTFPQLEYPRRWPAGVHVVGPLMWEPPFEFVEPPPGEAPLVLVAPSTAQDPEHRLLRAALAGLGDQPIRVLATWNRRPLGSTPVAVPANTRLVEWVSYAKTMPSCALVICHAGHGTMARALACGCSGARGSPLRRHGRERRAGGLGGRRRQAALAVPEPGNAAARGAPRAVGDLAGARGAAAGGLGGGA